MPFIGVCVVFANKMTGNVKLDHLTLIKTKRKCFSSYTDVFKITTKHRGAYLLKFHIFSFTFKAWKRQIQKWEFTEYLLTLRHPRCRWDHQNRFGEVLHHLFTSGSSAVNGCRQNESPNSNHSNPQVIHTTPVHQLTIVFVKPKAATNPSRHFLASNCRFWPKYESP